MNFKNNFKKDLRDIGSKIKDNKVKISIISGFLTISLITSTICGTYIKFETSKSSINKKPPYYHEPGVIKFDENGNLLIPTVIDEDNPSGNYDYKPSYTVGDVPEELKKDKDFTEKVNKQNIENYKSIKALLKDVLDKEIKVDWKVKSIVNRIIPTNNIKIDETTSVETFFNTIYKDSTEFYKERSLSIQDIRDFSALSGINFDKEYDKIMRGNYDTFSTVYGGGGWKPPSVNNPAPPIPPDNGITPENMTFNDQDFILKQNIEYLYIFAMTNSIVLCTLTIISATLTALSIITGGSSLISLAAIIPDILFSSYTIVSSWDEYYATKDARERLFSDVIDNVVLTLGIGSSFIDIIMNVWSIMHSVSESKKKSPSIIKKMSPYKTSINRAKFFSITRLNLAKSINSAISIVYSVVMKILHDELIKDTWIDEVIND